MPSAGYFFILAKKHIAQRRRHYALQLLREIAADENRGLFKAVSEYETDIHYVRVLFIKIWFFGSNICRKCAKKESYC